MALPFFIKLPTVLPPDISDDDRTYNAQHKLSPKQKSFLTDLITQLKGRNLQLLGLSFGSLILLMFVNVLFPLAIQVTGSLFFMITFGFFGIWLMTRTLIKKLIKDLQTDIVAPVILKNFYSWWVEGQGNITLLYSVYIHDTRPGVRYVLPSTQFIIGRDPQAILSEAQQLPNLQNRKVKTLWQMLGWIFLVQFFEFYMLASLLSGLAQLVHAPTNSTSLLMAIALVAAIFIPLDRRLPAADKIIKDISSRQIATLSGTPTNIVIPQRNINRMRRGEAYVKFTLADQAFSVLEGEFMLVDDHHQFEVEFFQYSKLVTNIRLLQ